MYRQGAVKSSMDDTYISGKEQASGAGNGQESPKSKYQLLLITNLKKEIEKAKGLCPERIAAEIQDIGFACQRCGECCRRAFGDNRVIVLPAEIEKIREYTGLPGPEVAGPLLPENFGGVEEEIEAGDAGAKEMEIPGGSAAIPEFMEEEIDSEGNIHTFGWMLKRKRNGDCSFLEEGTNRCRIYPVRSMLCGTYPFYMEELELRTCECDGLGAPISKEESLKLAKTVLARYRAELEDMLAMYEKFESFEKGESGPEIAKKNAETGLLACIVHDSNGAFKIPFLTRKPI